MERRLRLVPRRTVLKGAAGAAAMAAIPGWLGHAQRSTVPNRTFDPRSFGAKGDGQTKDTAALQQAIDRCAAAGGGTVIITPGTYLTGSLFLKGNMIFEVQEGATILGSPDPNDYKLPPPEALVATPTLPGRHLLFAFRADRLTLRGPGIIDGHSSAFLARSDHPAPKPEDMWKEVVSNQTVRTTRISPMVELANCNDLRVENITLQNAAGWTLRPVGCNGVTIQGVKVRNPLNASNADGIDPTSSQDVLVTGCDIITGDDGICVKSNNPYGGNTVCRNVTVTNCKVSTCCNGLKVGAEGPASFENIVFKDCEVYSSDGPLNERVAAGIDVEMSEHATIDGVHFSNITMRNVRTPIFIRLQGRMSHTPSPPQGRVENVSITGLRATGATMTSSITGQPGYPVEQINLSDVVIATEENGKDEWVNASIPENSNGYPGSVMMGRLPAYGLYARHVKGLQLQNFSIQSKTGDPRPMLVCQDVQGLTANRITGTPAGPQQAILDLRSVQTAMIRESSAPAGTHIYARVSGSDSRNITFAANDLHQAAKAIDIAADVQPDAVKHP